MNVLVVCTLVVYGHICWKFYPYLQQQKGSITHPQTLLDQLNKICVHSNVRKTSTFINHSIVLTSVVYCFTLHLSLSNLISTHVYIMSPRLFNLQNADWWPQCQTRLNVTIFLVSFTTNVLIMLINITEHYSVLMNYRWMKTRN